MSITLVGDILYMILDVLGDEKDYNSLYQCAISSKCLTQHALSVLYRLYDTSPLRGGGTEDEQFKTRRPATSLTNIRGEQDPTIKKWILLWRSIVLSTLDKTYLPYYSYIRYLDLDDLGDLLGSSINIKNEFFTPELLDLVTCDYVPSGNKRLRSSKTIPDNEWIKEKFGSAIVKKTSSIRGMSCNVSPNTLSEWIEGLPQLQSLTIWSGGALGHHAGERICKHCPDFKQLRIYTWQHEPTRTAETASEEFLTELRPDSLQYFEVLSFCQLGPRSIKAFGSQLNSLTELKLTSLNIVAIAELPSLTAPPALKLLMLTDSMPTAKSDAFYETVARVAEWIRSCKKLRRLELRRFVDDPVLLSQVLGDEGIRLTSLSLSGYSMLQGRAFHEALSSQQSLESLYLRGEGSEFPQDNELLVQAIAQLHDLRELELKDISDFFTPDHIMTLTPFLPHLERLWVSGDLYNDSVWTAFLCLPNLQSLAIYALSSFTVEGILDFISQLGPGNWGFYLSILNATADTNITETAQNLIRETLSTTMGGTFDFGLAQEEYSDADSEDMSD